jgi:hypothetical protein
MTPMRIKARMIFFMTMVIYGIAQNTNLEFG